MPVWIAIVKNLDGGWLAVGQFVGLISESDFLVQIGKQFIPSYHIGIKAAVEKGTELSGADMEVLLKHDY